MAATREDWLALFRAVKKEDTFCFYEVGSHQQPEVTPLSLEMLPNLGLARAGISIFEARYLVLPSVLPLQVRRIDRYDGTTVHSVDHGLNEDSFVIQPDGLHKAAYWVEGTITSVYNSGVAAAYAKRLNSRVCRKYVRPSWYYAGPDFVERYAKTCTVTQDFRMRFPHVPV